METTLCCQNGFLFPVLKHGPRSLTYVRVQRWKTLVRNESDSGWTLVAQSAGLNPSGERSECEHTCWEFNQARVNGGSNYDSLKVAKCLVI